MTDRLDWNAKTIAEFRANQGRVGGNFKGAPAVLLHHRGRKSGREYVTIGRRRTRQTGRQAALTMREPARPLPSRRRRGLEPAERELVVRDRDVERVQGRHGPGAHRPALARLRIGELVKGRRGTGLAEYRCSPLVLRWMIGRVVAIHEDRLTGGDRDSAQRGRRSPSHLRAAAAQMTAPA
jgi:hypothetical protein